MKLKGNISISRPNYGSDGKEVISIKIKDRKSRIQFLEIEMSYKNFAQCLTGLSEVNCDLKTRNLENIGKIKETKTIEFEIPDDCYDKEEIKQRAKKHVPENWKCSFYFGSKDSTFNIDNKRYARTSIYKYVEE